MGCEQAHSGKVPSDRLKIHRDPLGPLPQDFLDDPRYIISGPESFSKRDRVARVVIVGEAKQLTLKYLERINQVRGRLEAFTIIKSNYHGKIRIPGETTALFQEGRAVMQEIADILGHPIFYTFRTGYFNVYHWAISAEKGGAVFGWTETDLKDVDGAWQAQQKITPLS